MYTSSVSTLSYFIYRPISILTLFYALLNYNLNVEYFSPYKITYFTVKMEAETKKILVLKVMI